jgi:hypothetical protein
MCAIIFVRRFLRNPERRLPGMSALARHNENLVQQNPVVLKFLKLA